MFAIFFVGLHQNASVCQLTLSVVSWDFFELSFERDDVLHHRRMCLLSGRKRYGSNSTISLLLFFLVTPYFCALTVGVFSDKYSVVSSHISGGGRWNLQWNFGPLRAPRVRFSESVGSLLSTGA